MGGSAADLSALVEAVGERPEVSVIELNVSCPNVRTGLDIGADPGELAAVLREVRPRTRTPLVVKLTPNTADVAACARAAEAEGADAISLVNTLRALAPHPDRPADPWLGGRFGGLSGPADPNDRLFPLAATPQGLRCGDAPDHVLNVFGAGFREHDHGVRHKGALS